MSVWKNRISLFSFLCFNFENCCAISYLNLVGAVELKVVKPHGETTPLGVAHAICALLDGDGSGLIFFENNFSTDLVRWVVLDSISRRLKGSICLVEDSITANIVPEQEQVKTW